MRLKAGAKPPAGYNAAGVFIGGKSSTKKVIAGIAKPKTQAMLKKKLGAQFGTGVPSGNFTSKKVSRGK